MLRSGIKNAFMTHICIMHTTIIGTAQIIPGCKEVSSIRILSKMFLSRHSVFQSEWKPPLQYNMAIWKRFEMPANVNTQSNARREAG
jgi:hypothetical protein